MTPRLLTLLAPVLAAAVLAGCSQEPQAAVEVPAAPSTAPTAKPAASSPALAVDGEGLRLFDRDTGSASPLPFGIAADAVLGSIERLRGPAQRGTPEDFGAGPVQYASWADGLSLVLQDGRFAGWGLDGRARGVVFTASGVGPGSTRAQLDDAYGDVTVSETSLGQEFSTGGFSGVLDGPGPEARITDMWAGVSCVAR